MAVRNLHLTAIGVKDRRWRYNINLPTIRSAFLQHDFWIYPFLRDMTLQNIKAGVIRSMMNEYDCIRVGLTVRDSSSFCRIEQWSIWMVDWWVLDREWRYWKQLSDDATRTASSTQPRTIHVILLQQVLLAKYPQHREQMLVFRQSQRKLPWTRQENNRVRVETLGSIGWIRPVRTGKSISTLFGQVKGSPTASAGRSSPETHQLNDISTRMWGNGLKASTSRGKRFNTRNGLSTTLTFGNRRIWVHLRDSAESCLLQTAKSAFVSASSQMNAQWCGWFYSLSPFQVMFFRIWGASEARQPFTAFRNLPPNRNSPFAATSSFSHSSLRINLTLDTVCLISKLVQKLRRNDVKSMSLTADLIWRCDFL
jgi:hypothetical protein